MLVLGTKSEAEREDEEAERLVREAPKDKPPRRDRRRERMESDRDPDVDSDPDLAGRDTSLNYKSIGGSTLERLVLRFAVRTAARRNRKRSRGLKRKKSQKKIPALSKETGERVFISPDTLRTEPGKYERLKPKDESPAPESAVRPKAPEETPQSPPKARRPKQKKPKGEPPAEPPKPPQVVKRTDEPSDDDHEYEEVDLDDEKEPGKEQKSQADGEKPEPEKPEAGSDEAPKKKKTKKKPKGEKAKEPEPEPSVADKLGIKPPKQREASAEEMAEVALVLADTLPPAIAAQLIAKRIHPDDVKTVISSYKAAASRPMGNPSDFAAKAAKVYQTDPDKVEPPKTWRTADGKKVAFEELAPDEQATAYRQHQMQVVAMSLAARQQLEERILFGGAVPTDVAKVVTATLLGDAKTPDPKKVFDAVTQAEGFSRIADGSAKQMLAAVKGNDAAHSLVQAFLEGNDYKQAKDLYLGRGMFSERDDPKSIAEGLRSARDFFKVRGSAYGSDGHEGAKRFETKVLGKLRELEPEKYQKVRKAIDAEDAKAYEGALEAHEKALKAHEKAVQRWSREPVATRGAEPPEPPVAPIEPASYSNTKNPEVLKREGRELWDDLFERSGQKKTAASLTWRYLISSYPNRIAMGRTTDAGAKRALYHGVDPGVHYPREAYPGPTQVPSRAFAEQDEAKILTVARVWLSSPVLTQGMTGLESDERSRFALDLSLSDGAYRLDATTYSRLLAQLQDAKDPGATLVDELPQVKTAKSSLQEQIFRKFPPDSRQKAGGRLNVLLTGTVAKQLGKPAYTQVALDDLDEADLEKLAETLRIKTSSSSFASAGESTPSTTSNGRPITETVNMLRLSSEQRALANQSLSTLDTTAQLIQENHKAWGIPFKVAKDIVNNLDKAADVVETLIYGENSLRNRQAEIAVGSEDFAKDVTAGGLISKTEFAKAAKVIQRDSDESYMETFGNPHKPVDTNADEPYMSAYGDDQSSAVNNGKDTAGRALAP